MLYPAELRARKTPILLHVDVSSPPTYSAALIMFRWNPPFLDVQVRRELLEGELAELRGLPYSVWCDVVGRSMWKSAVGRDERRYRVCVMPSWAIAGSADVRVTVALESAALHRPLMRQSFIITPDNQLRD